MGLQQLSGMVVFKAYHHHQPDVIFRAGIPDLKGTLPHA
jgi:hypothetical protein